MIELALAVLSAGVIICSLFLLVLIAMDGVGTRGADTIPEPSADTDTDPDWKQN